MTTRIFLLCSPVRFNRTSMKIHRMISSSSNGNIENPSSELLTLATAKQLKGDIPQAIDLANRALAKQRVEGDPLILADTTLFLGKLFQLEERYSEAESSFDESRRSSLQSSLGASSRNEYVAQSHLATAQKHLQRYDEAEKNFEEALRGLEKVVGWGDGFTNHTGFEFARLYRETGRQEEAKNILLKMQRELVAIFGVEDARVLQLNAELAEIYVVMGDRSAAISLLEEVVDRLSPKIPEARRAFFRLEELKEL
mmetsp:Transcript_30286/g.69405  ORF Transcript_30286/g.69405 Transcript_30286/m.69405 type:complete len:255 (-) Transcript_30286:158-922(-)|eukprot:CAMPEP_0113310744 /NCGR_PEP_ID=MMETSP0010_2-20120614/8267_1 /TAXON_ID=216773 ORGANISM="Corethron hystrix, Strain 308" /NCGR_SAMPLE_ID=MMETSP0010_2 /ASSEMBLY_ACC=CAM_ASM_000155 /LENGTH=254 /DNA_ID=CAMNT_0000166261 /DNA_START=166 /DNA_END=930 /DNA_ORIENTATION=- /assembly_acc=CAM_ASM_000155